MAFKEDDLNEIIDDLYEDPAGYGGIVRNLLQKSNRLLLNFPLIGPARKVAEELKKGPFSLYYKFERTLAHKIHPVLFDANLNIITNDRIERQFNDRFQYYENMTPKTISKGVSLDPLKDLITSMVDRDGHFMVIKYCDYHLQNQNPSLSNHLRAMEFKLNYLKKHLGSDEDANREMVKKKCEEFTSVFGEDRRDLFIERLRLDDELYKYIPFLTDGEDAAVAAPKTLQYADRIKNKYLKHKDPHDIDGIESVVRAVEKSNAGQHGEEKSREIMKQIINHWLQDDELNHLQDALEQIFLNSYSTLGDIADDVSPEETDLFDSTEPSEQNNKGDDNRETQKDVLTDPEDIDIDIDLTGDDDSLSDSEFSEPFEVKEESEQQSPDSGETDLTEPFEIEDSEATENDSFTIAESENDELDNFDIAADEKDELSDYQISGEDEQNGEETEEPSLEEINPEELSEKNQTGQGEAEEPGEFAIADKEDDDNEGGFEIDYQQLLDQGAKKLKIIDERIQKQEEENHLIAASLDDMPDQEAFNKALSLRHNELYNGDAADNIMQKLSASEDVFFKIVRYLEDGPFKVMTLREKKEMVDKLIQQYKDRPDLAEKLENYKKTLANLPEMLSEVFEKLYEIEKSSADAVTVIRNQMAYLEQLLENEDYEPLWKTIRNLYENLIQDKSQKKLEEMIIVNETEEQWKRALILQNLQQIFSGNPEAVERIEEALSHDGLNQIARRMHAQNSGQAVNMEKIMKAVTGEDFSIARLAESFTGSEPSSAAASTEDAAQNQNLWQMVNDAGDLSKGMPDKLITEIKKILADTDDAASIRVIEDILNEKTVAAELKDLVIQEYGRSEHPLHKELYLMHSMVNNRDTAEEKAQALAEFKKTFPDTAVPDDSFERKKTAIAYDAAQNKAAQKLSHGLKNAEQGGHEQALRAFAAQDEIPDEVKHAALKIAEVDDNKAFAEAFFAITSSNNKADMKIGFLESLKSIAVSKGWITEGDKNAAKIDKKIEFYRALMNKHAERKKDFQTKKDSIIENTKKRSAKKKSSDDAAASEKHKHKNKKKEHGDENLTESDLEKLPVNEQAYRKALALVKNFHENIEALEPVVPYLQQVLDPEHFSEVSSAISAAKKQSNIRVKKTIDMIENKEIDTELMEELNTAGPKERFLWGEKLKAHFKVTKLEDVFKPLIKEKKLPESIDRIIRVIKSNNKNDFLKSSVQKENNLLTEISKNLTEDDLKRLKLKTRSSQDKEKIGLFRDLLRLKGGFISNRVDIQKGAEDVKTNNNVEHKKNVQPVNNDAGQPENSDDGAEKKKTEKMRSIITAYMDAAAAQDTDPLAQKKAEKYLQGVNSILRSLGNGDAAALDLVRVHKSDIVSLFVFIIKNKKAAEFPEASAALKKCMQNGLIRKEDLQ